MEIHLSRKLAAGECVCHNCPGGDNPACVNPNHLWIGSRADNNHDRHEKGRSGARGLRGASNPGAKLTEEQVIYIKKMCRTGPRGIQGVLADQFGVSRVTISAIHLHTWQHLEDGLDEGYSATDILVHRIRKLVGKCAIVAKEKKLKALLKLSREWRREYNALQI